MNRRGLLTNALALLVATSGRTEAKAKPRTGGHGGLLVPLGPYDAELLIWETSLQLIVSDRAGKTLDPKRFQANARITKRDGAAKDLRLSLAARGERLRSPAPLEGAKTLTVELTLREQARTYTAALEWRRDEDRARIQDGMDLEGLRL